MIKSSLNFRVDKEWKVVRLQKLNSSKSGMIEEVDCAAEKNLTKVPSLKSLESTQKLILHSTK